MKKELRAEMLRLAHTLIDLAGGNTDGAEGAAKRKPIRRHAYLAYEVVQGVTEAGKDILFRTAKRLRIPGALQNWEVGMFDLPSGAKVCGVKLSYADKDRPGITKEKIIPVSPYASNVQVLFDKLPKSYELALEPT